MDSFSSSPSSGSSPQISAEQFMDQLKNQLAQAYYEETLEDPLRAWQKITSDMEHLLPRRLEQLLFTNQKKLDVFICGKQDCILTIRGKCFHKCITKPGSTLSGSESSCISRCVDRYIEATGIISKALFSAAGSR